MRRSRSSERTASACSGHSTVRWWLVATSARPIVAARSGATCAVTASPSRSMIVRLYDACTGSRASTATACSVVEHSSSR